MRSDHTATELAQSQPPLAPLTPLAMPLDGAGDTGSRKQVGALARVTFCFAWLFGLEPFLTGQPDDQARSPLDRH